jgi:phosphoribosylanthranilate isomerase
MSKVKICGLGRIEDITAVNSALPDYIGLVFANSRRRIDETTAAVLKERLDARITAVGVFADQDIETIAGLYHRGVIDMAQLHGDEDDGYIARLKERSGCPVIKAVGIGGLLPPLPLNADYLLFDTLSAQRGGTGIAFDWSVLKDFDGPPFFLAGGLTAQNVCAAVKALAPFCVDVSSGVETNGAKDADKIHEFARAARMALIS